MFSMVVSVEPETRKRRSPQKVLPSLGEVNLAPQLPDRVRISATEPSKLALAEPTFTTAAPSEAETVTFCPAETRISGWP